MRGDTEERRKIHLVNWFDIYKDKKQGGIELRQLKGLNQALLGEFVDILS